MADEIVTTIETLSKGVTNATTQLKEFTKAKDAAFAKGDLTSYNELKKYESALKEVIESEKERAKIAKDSIDDREEILKLERERLELEKQYTELLDKNTTEAIALNDKLLAKEKEVSDKKVRFEETWAKAAEAAAKRGRKAKEIINDALETQSRAFAENKKRIEETNSALLKHFDDTRKGKVYNALTSQLAGVAGKLTLVGLGYKFLARYEEAARVRTEIMIRSAGKDKSKRTSLHKSF